MNISIKSMKFYCIIRNLMINFNKINYLLQHFSLKKILNPNKTSRTTTLMTINIHNNCKSCRKKISKVKIKLIGFNSNNKIY